MKPVSPNQDTQTSHPWRLDRRIPAADGLYLAIPVSCPDSYVWLKTYMLLTFQQYSLPLNGTAVSKNN